jgi:Tol biopolymer transport system component
MNVRRPGCASIVIVLVALAAAGCGEGDPPPAAAVPAAEAAAGKIVFAQDGSLFAIDPDGSGLEQLTHDQANAATADISPDGSRIVYGFEDDDSAMVAVMDADGSNSRVLTPEGYQGQPVWSPDGKKILFERDIREGDNGLWLMNPDGSGLERLTRNPYAGTECGCDTDPAFSPDGKNISFVRVRSESAATGALFVMDADGSDLRRVTPWSFDPGVKHAWHPGGARILLHDNAHPAPHESSNLYVMNADGSGRRAITRFDGGFPNANAGSWSPDGEHMVFKNDETGGFQLYVAAADGSGARRISTDLVEPTGITWGR